MRKIHLLNQVLCILITLMFLFLTTSCGTLLYPERVGQSPGRIDPAIAILDGVGLLLFLVPGIIAFAVDFSTGAIYLPPGNADACPQKSHETIMIEIDVAHLDTFEQLLLERRGPLLRHLSLGLLVLR